MTVSKKRSRKQPITPKNIVKILLILIPIVLISYVIGSVYAYVWPMKNYFIDGIYVDSEDFMEADPEYIASATENWSKYLYTYCFPQNMTGDGWDYYPYSEAHFVRDPRSFGLWNESEFLANCDEFNPEDPFNIISYYHGTGHAAAYAGQTLVGEALKYALSYREGDEEQVSKMSQKILKVVKAFSLLSELHEDGRMARYVVPDTPKARSYFQSFLYQEKYDDTHIIYNVSYVGPNEKEYVFWVESGTSVDLYNGVLTGLGIAYQFVNNQTIRTLIRETVDRMLEFFVNTGWRIIDYDGKTHLMGAEALNQQPIMDTSYCIMFLRVGKTVHPERWDELYDKYVYNRMHLRKVGKQTQVGFHDVMIWGYQYFNIDLMMTLAFTLCVLEDNPQLRRLYQDYFLKPIYHLVKYHRNAWFDTAFALGMADLDYTNYITSIHPSDSVRLSQEELQFLENDVADCLMRCALTKKTGRRFTNPNGFDSYNNYAYLSPIEDAPYPNAEIFDWESLIDENNPIQSLFKEIYNPEMGWTHPNGIWDTPIPADWRRTTTFMWEYSPFDTIIPNYSGVDGAVTGDMTLPYWIGRFLDFETLSLV
ncbi:MAG: hypothetical protein GF364_08490 [Candidatus Lokiarchaeota archaeon]|nr:hypothetical protein [Candidatus Lokiarchaeota archaeon]